MKRRSFILSLAVLAGCSSTGENTPGSETTRSTTGESGGREPDTETDTNEPTETEGSTDPPTGTATETATPTTTTPANAYREISIDTVGSSPNDFWGQFEVAVLNEFVSPETPGKVKVSLENTSDSTGRYRHSNPVVFAEGPSESDPKLLLLEPLSDFESTEDCAWQLREPFGYLPALSSVEIESGETRSAEYHLYVPSDADGCFPPGSYRFEDRYDIDDFEFTWGFSVSVDAV
jgi:hypothetical protein